MPSLWYLNSGFDLELSSDSSHHLHGVIAQMTQWFIPVVSASDFVLLDLPAPAEFLDYLQSVGIEPPKLVLDTLASGCGGEPSCTGEPWAWSESSVERLSGAGAKVEHPPVQVVADVNSRDFCYQISKDRDLGTPGAYLETDPERLLDQKLCPAGPIVVKTMHSNAGRGMLVRRAGTWSERQIAFIKKISSLGQTVVVEPWLPRLGDLSSRFDLGPGGELRDVFHYWTLIGPDGHCAGDFIEHGAIQQAGGDFALGDFAAWSKSMDRSVEEVGQALADAGYFGPVGLDHFVYKDGDRPAFVAAVDVNARHTLGTLAVGLHKKLLPDRPLLLRLISKKKHHLPAGYDDLKKLLGDLCWDRQSGQGVILLTALRVESGGSLIQPARSLFCIQARDRAAVKGLYLDLLKRIGNRLDSRLPFEALGHRGELPLR